MLNNRRIKNRILQALYRPNTARNQLISVSAQDFFNELDTKIEEKITPLLAELFDD